MKILLLGANGQLGRKIAETMPEDVSLVSFGHQGLDISDSIKITDLIKKESLKGIINCAAYTQVDKAESEQEEALRVNGYAVAELAKLCKEASIFLIHFSTDYIYSGDTSTPYKEDKGPSPLGVYGKSKLIGEQAILNSGCSYAVIRTSWVYAEYGKNFFRTIATKLLSNSPLRVVNDQTGTPTYAGDLAKVTWEIVEILRKDKDFKETLNYTNDGVTTWFGFAQAIAQRLDKKDLVTPINSSDYPTAAQRPKYSVLDKSKIRKFIYTEIPSWEQALDECFKRYKKIEGI